MDDEAEAMQAIRNLDGYELHGLRLRVQESTSRVRQTAGMGNPDQCYRYRPVLQVLISATGTNQCN